MKKNIAKLLIFAMLLTMIPFAAAETTPAESGSGGGSSTATNPAYEVISDVTVAGENVNVSNAASGVASNSSSTPYVISADVASDKAISETALSISLGSTKVNKGHIYTLENDTAAIPSTGGTEMTFASDSQASAKSTLSAKLDLSSIKDGGSKYFGIALWVETKTNEGYMVYYKLTVKVTKAEPETYKVTEKQSTGGTVTATPKTAAEGAKVKVTAKPNDGYTLEAITVTKSDNTVHTTLKADGEFTMPASDVTVSATFKKTQTDTPTSAEPTIKLSKTSLEVMEGESSPLTATIENAVAADVTWKSANDATAYIVTGDTNLNVRVVGKAKGTTTITATVANAGGKKETTCEVTVTSSSVDGVGKVVGTEVENVPTPDTAGKDKNQVDSMNAAAKAINDNKENIVVDNLGTAAQKTVTDNKPTQQQIDAAVGDLDKNLSADEKKVEARTIIVPKLKIEVSDAKKGTDNNISSLVFNITAVAEIRVTRIAVGNPIPDGKSALVGEPVDLNGTRETITITLPLPESFRSMTRLVVKHRKNSELFWHKATPVSGVGIRFINSRGFSEFAVENATGEAVIGETYYPTIADAIRDASSDATIIVLDNDKTAENVNKALTFQPAEGVTGLTVKPADGFESVNNSDGSVRVKAKSSGGDTNPGGGGNPGSSGKPAIKQGDKPTTPGTTTPGGGVAGFNDVAASAWYADSVKYVVERGLFGGVGNGNFAPNANMTRAMMWTVLARYMGVNTNTGSNWYEAARTWAIAQGISDGTMADGNVTREQFVTMLWRLSGEPAVTNSASFTDSGKVSAYAKTAVDWAVEQGIVNGYNDGTFKPQGSATRAEVAKMLAIYCQANEQGTAAPAGSTDDSDNTAGTPTDANGASLGEG